MSALGNPYPLVDPVSFFRLDAVWFSLAGALLGALDISMPRRDVLSVGAVLDAVALLVGGIPAACLTACSSAVASLLFGHRTVRRSAVFRALFLRLSSSGFAALFVIGLIRVPGLSRYEWLVAGATVCAYLIVNLAASQLLHAGSRRRPLKLLVAGNLALQGPLLLAQASSALLVVTIYPSLGAWSLPLTVALLLLMRQSYALLLEMREAYRTTVEVLVEAAEGLVPGRRGHAEGTARIARILAAECGMSSGEIERVAYSALLHDLAEIGSASREGCARTSTAVIGDVRLFHDVQSVIRICDGLGPDACADPDERAVLAAFIVALASDIEEQLSCRTVSSKGSHAARIAPLVPSGPKACVVSAAIKLGFRTPALS